MRTLHVMVGTGHGAPPRVRYTYPKGLHMEIITILLDTIVAALKVIGGGAEGLIDFGSSVLSSTAEGTVTA